MKYLLIFLFLVSLNADQNLTKCPEEQSFSGVLKQMEEKEEKTQNLIQKIAASSINQNIEQALKDRGVVIDRYIVNSDEEVRIPAVFFLLPVLFVAFLVLLFINFFARKIYKKI